MGEHVHSGSYVDLESGSEGQAGWRDNEYLEPLSMSGTPKAEPVLWRSWEKGRRSSTGRGDQSPGPRRLSDASPELPYIGSPTPGYLKKSLNALFFGTWFNVLLPFFPLAILAAHFHLGHATVFTLTCLALAPLSERLGYITEQLALVTNPTLGGLLNATFSNAPELILSLFALKAGVFRVVQLTLLGSILGNILLVVGCAFLAGGVQYQVQSFNKTAATTNAGLLLMSVMSILFPTVLVAQHTEIRADASLTLSRTTSVLMLLAYTAYILFQLVTHKNLFDAPAPPPAAPASTGGGLEAGGEDGDEEEDEIVLGFTGGIVCLALVTAAISSLSDYLVSAIEGAAVRWGVPLAFLSVIVIPIANNVTEHAAAIGFAVRNKVDISLGIALGSSTQIAMFVLPLVVLVGWAQGLPLTLDFRVFATAVLFSSTIVVAYLLQDGESNWLKGLMLIIMYVVVAAGFFLHKDSRLLHFAGGLHLHPDL